MATPLSAVSNMQSLSLLSSLRAIFCALVRLGLGGCEDLRTLLTSALSSSASCWLSLVQAASMAVKYSKLGGCLGVTAKLGPLARTDLCAGVKGLLERLMTHLGLGSSLEEPWLDLLGCVEVGLPSLEVAQASWEGWVGCCLGGCLVPCLLALGGLLLCPHLGCPRGLRVISYRWRSGLGRIVFFPCGSGTCLLGGAVIFRGKVYSSRERIASFPGGRWAIASVWLGERPWLFAWLFIELIVVLLMLLAWLLRKLLPFSERWTVARGRVASFPGRKESSGRSRVAGTGRDWTCLFIGLVMLLLAIAIAIFPSFFDTKWFSLFICLCFTLLNLSSLTLLMKPWHSSSLSSKMIEASLALQSCISLSTWSKILLIALTLACSKSFSAFLIICLAFGVS